MSLRFHRLVQHDVWDAMRFYQDESGEKLADDFYAEFMAATASAAAHPGHYHFDSSGLRRAGMKRFPYHFLYRQGSAGIYLVVLRHDRRHPSFGLKRR